MLPEAVCNRIHTNHADAVETLSRLIGFPSVAAPQPQDGYPYGKPAADALDFMLHQLEELGMTCTNYEYHMGAADWDASLPQHLGILCHSRTFVVDSTSAVDSAVPDLCGERVGLPVGRHSRDGRARYSCT